MMSLLRNFSNRSSAEERITAQSVDAEKQAALQEAQKKAGLLDSLPTPTMSIDKEFTVTYMNEAGAGALGRTPADCVGQKCYNLFNTPHCNTPDCQLGKAMREDRVCTGKTVAALPGGELPIRYTGTPLKDENGRIVGGMEYVVDISEEERLMAEASVKVEILNGIPTPVMVIDKECNVEFMNPAGAKALGKTPEECQGKKCFDLFNTKHCNTSRCAVMKAMRENVICTDDTVASLPSGDLPIRYTGAPLKDEQGNVIGGLEYVVDITEENRAVDEVSKLVEDALDGKLDSRGNPENYTINGFRKVVQGINDTLEAIVAPITEVMKVLEKASAKDLRDRVEGDYKGQLDEFKNNVNNTLEALEQALVQVSEAVEQVTSASNQISSGSQSLAEGANEQASSIEEISSSLEEITSMTNQNADSASQANSLSADANKSAVGGSKSMERMIEAINAIKASSDETSKIVKTIDEIAFQTNLLALNAAVEAARAGEAGKGFAVVAEEVRNLAQRSAEAAKNTASLIEESVGKAENGVQITDEVAKALQEITEGTGKVSDLVAELAASAQEQRKGIEQINTAVSQMDQVTQQNASNSEESASAAEELNGQAEELMNMVTEFALTGLSGDRGSALRRPPVHQPPVNRMKAGEPRNRARLQMAEKASRGGDGNSGKDKKTSGNGAKAGKASSPEQIIPLDDSDFEDF